jgi:hypothetical protein
MDFFLDNHERLEKDCLSSVLEFDVVRSVVDAVDDLRVKPQIEIRTRVAQRSHGGKHDKPFDLFHPISPSVCDTLSLILGPRVQ